MISNIFLFIIASSYILSSYSFVPYNANNYLLRILNTRAAKAARAAKAPPRDSGNMNLNNCNMRYMNDISRRNIIELLPYSVFPVIIHPKYVLAYKNTRPVDIKDDIVINKVAVFGASGYTGGDTVRTLLNKNINVVAITRRNVEIVDRNNAKSNTLVIDNIKDKDKIKKVAGVDVIKPETLDGILYGCDAVIYCAASRPAVKITGTPGTEAYDRMLNDTNANKANGEIAEPSSNVEDIGLVNVAKEAIKANVKRLVIVSSICAKCQLGKENYGETIDRGFASCDSCYKKQTGEERVRILYKNVPANMSYTIVRPGMLSPGERRGATEVEFNQGVSKSGIISRIDLADVLVAAAKTNKGAQKTFEVYYKDTAQPVDMYKSLKTCKEMGKSVKECFFGEGYNNTEPLSIDKMLNTTIKGTIFPSGNEVSGDNYEKMLGSLTKDVYESYDINLLMSKDII
jgi:nucleoside-diphosphate-sugar epimerase